MNGNKEEKRIEPVHIVLLNVSCVCVDQVSKREINLRFVIHSTHVVHTYTIFVDYYVVPIQLIKLSLMLALSNWRHTFNHRTHSQML